MSDYLNRLSQSISALYGCKATHVSTKPVKETFRGRTVWEGLVEVFDLSGHSAAKRIFAWGYPNPENPEQLEVTTVLAIPPVNDEQTAVRAAIAAQRKKESGK